MNTPSPCQHLAARQLAALRVVVVTPAGSRNVWLCSSCYEQYKAQPAQLGVTVYRLGVIV